MFKIRCFILVLSCIGVFRAAYGQCKDLEFEEGVKKKLLSPDLFNTAINAPFMGCPNNFTGDAKLCGSIDTSNRGWDIGLPDALIFTAFFEPVHYSICKDIFKDKFFLETIKKIPDPSEEALTWFKQRNIYHNTLVSTERKGLFKDTQDVVQRKMITVMHQIRSWTFCPEKYATEDFIVHGSFDMENNIVVYNTACMAEQIYDADIKTMALAYRLFFVCSHELSHAMDKTAGLLTNKKGVLNNLEKKANVNGLIITLALSKLVNQMYLEYKKAIEKSERKAPCDLEYMNQLIKKWSKVSDYFTMKINAAKKELVKETDPVTIAKKDPNWSIFACLEPKFRIKKQK